MLRKFNKFELNFLFIKIWAKFKVQWFRKSIVVQIGILISTSQVQNEYDFT